MIRFASERKNEHGIKIRVAFGTFHSRTPRSREQRDRENFSRRFRCFAETFLSSRNVSLRKERERARKREGDKSLRQLGVIFQAARARSRKGESVMAKGLTRALDLALMQGAKHYYFVARITLGSLLRSQMRTQRGIFRCAFFTEKEKRHEKE